MPDQPADPIHYDMKIPPEPRSPEKPEETKAEDADQSANANMKETEDKPKQP